MTINEETRTHVLYCLQKGVRYDGRKPHQFRKISIEYGVSENAEGSTRVRIGDTDVIVGIKLSIEKPFPDRPDEGNIMVNVELLPLSSPEFEPGPPGIMAVELARVVDRGIRESHALDVSKLVIERGEKAWSVIIDVCTLNDDGGLLDACALAALAALTDTVFPQYVDGKLDYKHKTTNRLPLHCMPIAVTCYKIGPHLIVDPCPDEESVMDCRLTITTTEDGNVCSLQKGGDAPLTIEEIDTMAGLALERASELRSLLSPRRKNP